MDYTSGEPELESHCRKVTARTILDISSFTNLFEEKKNVERGSCCACIGIKTSVHPAVLDGIFEGEKKKKIIFLCSLLHR